MPMGGGTSVHGAVRAGREAVEGGEEWDGGAAALAARPVSQEPIPAAAAARWAGGSRRTIVGGGPGAPAGGGPTIMVTMGAMNAAALSPGRADALGATLAPFAASGGGASGPVLAPLHGGGGGGGGGDSMHGHAPITSSYSSSGAPGHFGLRTSPPSSLGPLAAPTHSIAAATRARPVMPGPARLGGTGGGGGWGR